MSHCRAPVVLTPWVVASAAGRSTSNLRGGGLIGLGVLFVIIGSISFGALGQMSPGDLGIPGPGTYRMKRVLSMVFVIAGVGMVIVGIATA